MAKARGKELAASISIVLSNLNGGGSSSFLLEELFNLTPVFSKNYCRAPDYQNKKATGTAFQRSILYQNQKE